MKNAFRFLTILFLLALPLCFSACSSSSSSGSDTTTSDECAENPSSPNCSTESPDTAEE